MTTDMNTPNPARPEIERDPARMREKIAAARAAGRRVGFVPTMGALHAGHASLAARARAECDDVAVSIFVNPTQFAPHEDFGRYPRTLATDCQLLGEQGVRWVFAPEVAAMYPPGAATRVVVQGPADRFEGASRPGHFDGVATVVCRLFQALPADAAYFGAKDWQQTVVVKRMVRDLDLRTIVVVCPTIREADGLAMSSRNCYLGELEREFAPALYHTLRICVGAIDGGEQEVLVINEMFRNLLSRSGPWRLDYFGVADPETMHLVQRINRPVCLLSAAFLGATRLIDNVMAHVSKVD